MHCQICDLAFEMGLSEKKFYEKFDKQEREQLLATFQSQQHRGFVIATFPKPVPQRR